MGATGWSYFVPYELDVSAALQRLREDVFAPGDYIFGDGLTLEDRQALAKKLGPEMSQWVQHVNRIPEFV